MNLTAPRSVAAHVRFHDTFVSSRPVLVLELKSFRDWRSSEHEADQPPRRVFELARTVVSAAAGIADPSQCASGVAHVSALL